MKSSRRNFLQTVGATGVAAAFVKAGSATGHPGPNASLRRFHTVQIDVFTSQRLQGNPLCVFTDARGLSDAEMQDLARETNLQETTFVFPQDPVTEREHGVKVLPVDVNASGWDCTIEESSAALTSTSSVESRSGRCAAMDVGRIVVRAIVINTEGTPAGWRVSLQVVSQRGGWEDTGGTPVLLTRACGGARAGPGGSGRQDHSRRPPAEAPRSSG